jgi:hypothetical protein
VEERFLKIIEYLMFNDIAFLYKRYKIPRWVYLMFRGDNYYTVQYRENLYSEFFTNTSGGRSFYYPYFRSK